LDAGKGTQYFGGDDSPPPPPPPQAQSSIVAAIMSAAAARFVMVNFPIGCREKLPLFRPGI